MSAFEQRRLQNIAANNEILRDLSNTASKIAKPAAPKPLPRSRPKRQPVEKREQPKRERAVATRASSRLKGETPKREADDAVPASLFPPDRPAKKARVNEDLKLGDILVEGRKFTNGVDAVTGLISLPRLGAEPGVRTFDEEDIKETTDEDLRNLREKMNSLEMYDKWAVNGGSKSIPTGYPGWQLTCVYHRHQNCSSAHILHGFSPNRGEATHFCRRQRRGHGNFRCLPGCPRG